MGMPGWALGLGALVKGPEYINEGLNLFKSARDMRRQDANDSAARDSVDNLAWAAQEQDPAVRLADFREVSRDMSSRPLNANTALALQGEVDKQTKGTQADIKTMETQKQLSDFQKEAADSGSDLLSYGMQHPDRIPLTALQGVHNALSTFATGAEKEIDRRAKDAKELEKQGNISAFQSAIAGLDQPSRSPGDLARFAKTGGYDPQGANDIRQAAADYNVPPEAVNKEVDNYRQQMEKTPAGAPYTKNLQAGNATSQQMLQDFVLGGPKQVGASVTNHPKAAPSSNLPGSGNDDLVQAVLEGRLAPKDLPKRQGAYTTIMAAVMKQNPRFDANKANANAGFMGNVGINRSVKLLDSISPMLDELGKTHAELGFGKYPALNKVKRAYLEQTGDGRVTAYDNLRNNIILEVTNAMSGSGQMSDSRVKMEAENLAKAQSPAQMKAALTNIHKIIGVRKEAFQAPPYEQTTEKGGRPIAAAGIQARVNGKVVTSDGKGGWK